MKNCINLENYVNIHKNIMKLQESNCEHSKPQFKQEINNIKQIEQ